MRYGIVGSRRRSTLHDRRLVFDIVGKIKKADPEAVIVSGGCLKGADHFAEEAAAFFELPTKIHYPAPAGPTRWHFAQAAFARNYVIAVDSDIGFALVHPDRKGGTENTVGHYEDLGKKVFLVGLNGDLYLPSEWLDDGEGPDKA